jgi:hypothetical protein
MLLELDVNEPDPWKHGLTASAWHGATVLVYVEGMDGPVGGELAYVSADAIVVVRPARNDAASGEVTWIPRGRVVAVTAPYRRADLAAERRHRVEADAELLERVKRSALAHLEDVRTFGQRTVRGPIPGTVADELDGDVPLTDIETALAILRDRGGLSPVVVSNPAPPDSGVQPENDR